ncbi:PTS sugar transporter subunit IIB [Erwinia psidii]|uniref:PTS sugar transporter subunit IIB n=1 Tax=Erwinia psidii TaxID=69224 RepID=A0A3N6S4S9_9GAMM|nr:PTS sugar transporter subunit IIB [Erwinia psidii]MCX8956596.1 PTS sugar transporter subunit IIB [Erwinia psidii]MCX8961494.1 PTS sugar transporter subunit IIB [Erwinia psidii]MCX8965038.1 PTS sugar transporter subunit IIB [Erwinia psidii]RQM39927.1 PTS sugar transporter subunit IIB [Erwinia psidii]
MKNILIICALGMSTSMLVNNMKKYAESENIAININAMAISEAKDIIIRNGADVVMLGPQVRYQKQEIEKLALGNIPVEVIDMASYGRMDGKSVLHRALQLMAER